MVPACHRSNRRAQARFRANEAQAGDAARVSAFGCEPHPDTLLITPRATRWQRVLRSMSKRDISLIGRGIESSRLYSDEKSGTEENLNHLDTFLRPSCSCTGPSQPSHHTPVRSCGAQSQGLPSPDMLEAFFGASAEFRLSRREHCQVSSPGKRADRKRS